MDGSNYFVYQTRAFVLGSINTGVNFEPLILSNLNAAIDLAPTQALYAYYNRGQLALQHRNVQESIRDFTSAIELGPADPGVYRAYVSRAAAYGVSSNYVAAINDAARAIELYPSEAAPYVILASVYNMVGNRADAWMNMEVARKIDPSNPLVVGVKNELEQTDVEPAIGLYNRGEYQEALRVLDDIQRMNESNYLVYETRAMVLDKMKGEDTELQILSNLNTAIQLAPQQAAYSYYQRGLIAFQNHDGQNALGDLSLALELKPEGSWSYQVHFMKSAILADQSNYVAAIENATQAIELRPQEALPYAILADCYHEVGNRAEAIQNLNMALELAPSNKVILDLKSEMGLE